MFYSSATVTRMVSALAITCAVAAFSTGPASAQTAEDLDCKGCVKSKQLKDGGVKGKDIKNGSIDGTKLSVGAVGQANLATDAVTSVKVQDSTLTGEDVAGQSIPSTDLSNPAGVDFATAGGATITSADSTVVSNSLTAPSDGFVTVVASGTFDYTGTDTIARCSIRSGSNTTVNTNDDTRADISASTELIPFTVVKTFSQAAGTTTYRLNCDINTAGSASVDDMDIAIMFFPIQY